MKSKGAASRLAAASLMILSLVICGLAVEGVSYTLVTFSEGGYYERDIRNSLGLRDPREPQELQCDRVVLAIGDSFTYGLGVPYRDSYPAQLDMGLRSAAANVAAVNGGVAGFDTEMALSLLKRVYDDYEPSVVVLGFHPADVVQNQLTFAAASEQPGPASHTAKIDATFEEVVEQTEANSPTLYWVREFLRQKTSTFALLDYLYKTYAIKYLPAPPAVTNTGTGAEFAATERLLDEIHEFLSAKRNTQFVIVGIVALVRFDAYPYEQLNARLEAYARSRGVHFIDPLEEFAKHSSSKLWVSIRDGHYNAAGNRIVSDAVQAYLSKHGLLTAAQHTLGANGVGSQEAFVERKSCDERKIFVHHSRYFGLLPR